MSNNPRCQPILDELCSTLGYSAASREPQHFELVASAGAAPFAKAVLMAEGLDPVLHQKQFRAVLAVVQRHLDI